MVTISELLITNFSIWRRSQNRLKTPFLFSWSRSQPYLPGAATLIARGHRTMHRLLRLLLGLK